MNRIIDPPSPFASLQEWETFLAEMEAIEPKDDDVNDAIRDAKEQIAQLQAPETL